ncbi:MAG: hypothetical protein Tsb0034_10280 [Ekhidna sp.]
MKVRISFLLLVSCDKERRIADYKTETIEIDVPSSYLNAYVKKIVANDLLIGYNHLNHSLDLFDLKKLEPVSQIMLEMEGPKGITVSNLAVLDSMIITVGQRDLVYLDFKGNILKRVSLEQSDLSFDSLSLQSSMKYGNDSAPLCLIKPTSRIYFDVFKSGDNFPSYLGFFDLSEEKFRILRKRIFPAFTGDFGLLSDPDLIENDREHITLYTQYSDSIFEVDLNQNKIKRLRLKSSIVHGGAQRIKNGSPKEKHDHYVRNRFFGNLIYLESKSMYCRVVNKSNPESMFDRTKQYLCFFNASGEEINNFKLADDALPFLMKHKNGVLMQLKSNEEGKMRFMKVLI